MNRPAFAVVVALALAGCAGPQDVPSTATPATLGAPAAVPPKWLSKAELEQLTDTQIERLDAFTLAGLEGARPTTSVAEVKLVEPVAMLVKKHLATLMYDVSFEKLLHPSADPVFYATLVRFERDLNLEADGIFTFAEVKRLGRLSTIATERRISLPIKSVTGNTDMVSAVGTWVKGRTNCVAVEHRSHLLQASRPYLRDRAGAGRSR